MGAATSLEGALNTNGRSGGGTRIGRGGRSASMGAATSLEGALNTNGLSGGTRIGRDGR